MKKRYWRIEGFDSSDRVFQVDVPVSSYSENQLQRLLQTLAAKAGLTDREIVEAMGKRGTKFHSALLEVHHDKSSPAYSCGENPHFHARVVEKMEHNDSLQLTAQSAVALRVPSAASGYSGGN